MIIFFFILKTFVCYTHPRDWRPLYFTGKKKKNMNKTPRKTNHEKNKMICQVLVSQREIVCTKLKLTTPWRLSKEISSSFLLFFSNSQSVFLDCRARKSDDLKCQSGSIYLADMIGQHEDGVGHGWVDEYMRKRRRVWNWGHY